MVVAQLEGSLKGGHCEDGKQGVGLGFLGRVLVLWEARGWGRAWCILGCFSRAFWVIRGFLLWARCSLVYISVLGYSF